MFFEKALLMATSRGPGGGIGFCGTMESCMTSPFCVWIIVPCNDKKCTLEARSNETSLRIKLTFLTAQVKVEGLFY